jgi:integrase
MNTVTPTTSVPVVDSTEAISALAKEKIRMQAQRYQRGSLSILKRKSQPDAWMFRYYTEEDGRRVYKRRFVGTVLEFPKRKDAEKAVTQIRVEINEGAKSTPATIAQVVAHYKKDELPQKAYATVVSYTDFLNSRILPKWGESALSAIKSIEVENWLNGLLREDGKPTAPATRAKIRNVMSAVFSHAIRYGWIPYNPIKAVRTSTQRLRDPDLLSPKELQALLRELHPRERTMVLLDASTGLRRGELMALRWGDIDFETLIARVTRSIYRNVIGKPKTAASKKPVPLHPIVAAELKLWRAESTYRADSDFLFPSDRKKGELPLRPDMILKRYIRPVLAEMGVDKRIGWHSFRHGLATMLRQKNVDLKVAQDILRHANSRILIDIYQQAVTDEKREAQDRALKGFLGPAFPSAPKRTQTDLGKKRSSL